MICSLFSILFVIMNEVHIGIACSPKGFGASPDPFPLEEPDRGAGGESCWAGLINALNVFPDSSVKVVLLQITRF